MDKSPRYDLVLTGARSIAGDGMPAQPCDLAISGGTIAAVSSAGTAVAERWVADRELDLDGSYVSAGFVDLHGHFLRYGFRSCVDADEVCPPAGVTTAVDGGSAGCVNFGVLANLIAPTTRTRLFGFVNLSAIGLCSIAAGMPELRGLELAKVEETVETIRAYPSVAVGVKVRADAKATEPSNVIPAVKMARTVAAESATRVMVHIGDVDVPLASILDELAAGDIVTHAYHGGATGLVGPDGRVDEAAFAARERGVLFDVGHAGAHFDVAVARAALEQGLPPDTLSSDIHLPPPGRVPYLLPAIMSLFLGLGLELSTVLRAVTTTPSAAIGLTDVAGSIRVGAPADLTAFRLTEANDSYLDRRGESSTSAQRVDVTGTIVAGRIVFAEADDRPTEGT